MAHARQKFGLGAVGLFRHLARLLQLRIVGLDQRARVRLLLLQALVQQGLFRLDLLASRVVRADQQVTDDLALRIAQGRHGDDGGETAAILADVGQFINVFDAARGLEHERFHAGRDDGVEFGTEGGCARDDFLRVRNTGRRQLVDHVARRITEHAFGAHVENLDYALRIGGDA
ncbi:hypothetical protein D3C81_1694020 [compost metagenome]